jgi:hypothetical protein
MMASSASPRSDLPLTKACLASTSATSGSLQRMAKSSDCWAELTFALNFWTAGRQTHVVSGKSEEVHLNLGK